MSPECEWARHWRSGLRGEGATSSLEELDLPELCGTLRTWGFGAVPEVRELHFLENRVFGGTAEDGRALIVKVYRPGSWTSAGLAEEHRFVQELHDAGVPVSAPIPDPRGSTVGRVGGWSFAVYDRVDGIDRTLERLDANEVEALGRLAASIHAVGAERDTHARRRMCPTRYLVGADRFLRDFSGLAMDLLEPLGPRVEQIADSLADARVPEHDSIRAHGDLGLWNLVWGQGGPVVIDFDDMGPAPPVQDLALLALGIGGFGFDRSGARILDRLDRGYRDVRPLPEDWRRAVGPLLAARRVHVAAWIASRWTEERFRRKYWDFHSSSRWEREFAFMDRAAAWSGRSEGGGR